MRHLHVVVWCLLVAAIAGDLCGKRYYSQAAVIMARAQSDQTDRVVASANAHAAVSVGNAFANGGLVLAALGAVSWVASMRKGKRFTLIPMALLVFYVGLLFIMV